MLKLTKHILTFNAFAAYSKYTGSGLSNLILNAPFVFQAACSAPKNPCTISFVAN